MTDCSDIQERLAEEGAAALQRDADIRRHVEGCADCTAVLEALTRVDADLRRLPPHDAPDSLVADTLHAVRRAPRGVDGPVRPGAKRRRLARALAASVVVAAFAGLMYEVPANRGLFGDRATGSSSTFYRQLAQVEKAPMAEAAPADGNSQPSISGASGRLSSMEEESEVARQVFRGAGEDAQTAAGEPHFELREMEIAELPRSFANRPEEPEAGGQYRVESESTLIARLGGQLNKAEARTESVDIIRDEIAEKKRSTKATGPRAQDTRILGAKSKADEGFHEGAGSEVDQLSPVVPQSKEAAPKTASRLRGDERDKDSGSRKPEADPSAANEIVASPPVSDLKIISGGDAFLDDESRRNLSVVGSVIGGPENARLTARSFLARFESLEGLAFQDPTGYWANTYIPGDPAMRLLEARLRAWDRRGLGAQVRLEQAARQAEQPFDPPAQAALALYLHADRRGIQGPTRLRVQVGLKGAQRRGGHRPAMNVGLVVDLRSLANVAPGTGPVTGARIRALVTALERARQPGDRFSLTVAGPAGGVLVPPEQFRHGPLRVAMDRLFGETQSPGTGAVDLLQALSLATDSVAQGDQPDAVLGASLVLLATGASLADDFSALERRAHQNAVGGLPLSVVSLGAETEPDLIDRLVAAGQGHRRILESAAAADALIDRELHAASRAVARALRLRIRLAPGVKLVDVLGSRRLAEPQAQRVREAEQSIDLRLARNLGIRADRGRDEEGIQIVIPNFYAGDAHVVLLDVVAEGPGPIADVTLRYKDVAYLRNGVARAQLTLPSGGPSGDWAPGPLERNVLKNLVAWDLSRRTRRVGRFLEAGDAPAAGSLLASTRELIEGLRHEVAGWSGDPDLAADAAMLGEYQTVLNAAARDPVQRLHLAESLRYAAFRKVHPATK